jgi:hypothetical protein
MRKNTLRSIGAVLAGLITIGALSNGTTGGQADGALGDPP